MYRTLPFFTLGLVMLWYGLRGQLPLFVYPAYIPLVMVSAAALCVLVILGWWLGRRPKLGLPLMGTVMALSILALLIPVRPLSDATAQTRGVQTTLQHSEAPVFRFALNTASMELMDWMRTLGSDPEPQRLQGSVMIVTGMIVDDGKTLQITRYIISCCLADARPVGLRVQLALGVIRPASGSWQKLQGTLQFDTTGPFVLVQSYEPITPPSDPYVYL